MIKIKYGQSIFDMAIQMYGDISYVWKILSDNPELLNIQNQDITGFELKYDKQLFSNVVYFDINKIYITTGNPDSELSRSFDDSFELSFN